MGEAVEMRALLLLVSVVSLEDINSILMEFGEHGLVFSESNLQTPLNLIEASTWIHSSYVKGVVCPIDSPTCKNV